MKRKKFWVAGALLAIALGALVYNGVASSSVYYYSVQEIKARDGSLASQEVRVNGKVAPTRIEWDARSRTTTFTLQDKKSSDSIVVVYQGAVPDTFKMDAEVVVRGKLTPQGTFEGTELQARCASKYTPKL